MRKANKTQNPKRSVGRKAQKKKNSVPEKKLAHLQKHARAKNGEETRRVSRTKAAEERNTNERMERTYYYKTKMMACVSK